MNTLQHNIFAIVDAQIYQCRVLGYSAAHSLMFVEVIGDSSGAQEGFCLAFEAVRYFEGPLTWRGVSFRLGTNDEKSNTVALLMNGEPEKDTGYYKHLLERYNLFILEGSRTKVQIFAANATRETNCPQVSMILPES